MVDQPLTEVADVGSSLQSSSHPANGFGTMESEHSSTGGFGIETAREAGLDAGRLVQEWQRATANVELVWDALAVLFDCHSTPMSVVPFFLASTTPTAPPSTKKR